MRAVLDVNVLIAAVLSRAGIPAQLVAAWRDGRSDLVVSETLLAELDRALAYPKIRKRISAAEATAYVALLRSSAVLERDPGAGSMSSVDPGDDYLIALAEATDAYLVSGDQHVLDLAGRAPILTAVGFLEIIDRMAR